MTEPVEECDRLELFGLWRDMSVTCACFCKSTATTVNTRVRCVERTTTNTDTGRELLAC